MIRMKPLEIPLICEKICRYLPTRDLVTCRLLNKDWNSTAAIIIAERDEEEYPMINLTIENIESHLQFLNDRNRPDMAPIRWIRRYQVMKRGTNVSTRIAIMNFRQRINRLTAHYQQRIFSMYLDMPQIHASESFEGTMRFISGTFRRPPPINVQHLTMHVSSQVLGSISLFVPPLAALRLLTVYYEDQLEGLTVQMFSNNLGTLRFPLLEKFILHSTNQRLAVMFTNYLEQSYPNVLIEINP
ncbi:hypothetical protein Bhyg_04873 [Pseudolycoriella hygida]|uniref:F-box domain-containing protein n=1 Tax=Pseudolycoriella hygida TaxID=35572 RepID=A0A9Q0NG81_9DIPT|nr:hypothetical protein Bhyg_04873 [Pseudolycoriella hygida]